MPTPAPIPTPGATVPDTGSRPTPNVGAGKAQTQPRTGGLVGGVKDAVTDVLNPFSGVEATVSAIRAWSTDRHNWVRVAWFVGGVGMIGVGIAMLGGRQAGAAVTTVIPMGKAAKLVGKAMA